MQTPFLLRLVVLAGCLFSVALPSSAERLGDVDITPITIANGETHHGYREFRILVENHSIKNAHRVTLIYPDRSYNAGNAISRLSRTIDVSASSSAVVPLWQPPLPINGNNQLRVMVDDEEAGAINLPDSPRHFSSGPTGRRGYMYGYSGPPSMLTTILVSRSLNFDELSHLFNSQGNAADYSAQMATGPADSGGRGGAVPTAWMPAPSLPGPHWLELDYAPPTVAKGVRVYSTMPLPPRTEIFVKGATGTNLFHTNILALNSKRSHEFAFPVTSEPVKTVRLEFPGGSYGNIGIDAVELLSPSNNAWAATAHASSEATGAYGAPPVPGSMTRTLLRAELPMSQWSDSWLSYSPYDAVALHQSDLKALSPAALSAIWGYLECGGNLLVFGASSIPEPWQAFPKTAIERVECANVGFGRCFAFPEDRISMLGEDSVKAMIADVDLTARYWQSLPDEETANQAFPVIQNYRVPVRGTVFIMLLFVIAIGPANLIVLSRMNRRTWLLWTIPAISFLTCLTVFAYSYLREGVTPDTRISSLTVIDQANHRAASIGYSAFYCPLTPSQGLFFSADTEATPLVETWDYRSGTDRELDWSQAQHLGRGWVSARVPAHFELRKAETRRERLEVESEHGHLTILNGLGATIQSLYFADRNSNVYTANNVPAGQKVTLTPTSSALKKGEQLGSHSLLERCGAQADLSDGTPFLLPNTYVAVLDSNPFFENGLGPKAQTARTKSHAVVYGTLESPATP